MKRVICSAVIDGVSDEAPYKRYKITVTGSGDHSGIVRGYSIVGGTEDAAAMEGIRRFVSEHEK